MEHFGNQAKIVLLDFSLTVKAAPHDWSTLDIGES